MKELIIKKANANIGALCNFLKNEKNIEYLDELLKNIPVIDITLSEKIWYYVNDTKKTQLCMCGKHLSFIGFKNGYRPTCGDKKCFVAKRKETSLKNWGVDNPRKTKEVSDKIAKTIDEKYNGKHYM